MTPIRSAPRSQRIGELCKEDQMSWQELVGPTSRVTHRWGLSTKTSQGYLLQLLAHNP